MSGEKARRRLKHLPPPVELHKYETPSTDQLAASPLFDRDGILLEILLFGCFSWRLFCGAFLCEVFCATLWSYIWFAAIFCQCAALPTSSQCLQLLASSPSSLAQTAPWHQLIKHLWLLLLMLYLPPLVIIPLTFEDALVQNHTGFARIRCFSLILA